MKRPSALATALTMVMTLVIVTGPAAAQTNTDIVLDDSDLAGWTEPGVPGSGLMLVAEGEDSEQGVPGEPDTEDAAAPLASDDVIISGGGWSHSVGMSQYGAYALALADRRHSEILDLYYSGTTLSTNVAAESFWVGLEQELVKVVLTAKAIVSGASPVVVTRGGESVSLSNGQSVTIQYTGIAGGIRECTFSSGAFSSGVGPCNLDLAWDGWATSPTMRVVIDKVWYAGTASSGEECNHSIYPLVVECAYSRGTIHIRPDDTDEPDDIGFNVVLEIDRDDYALGIGEVPYSWPTETLKAQAVAARGYASYVTSVRSDPEDRAWCWCDLYDQSPDQVYVGWGFGTAKWVDAVHDTDRQLLTYGGNPALSIYGSSTGGATENVEDVWNGVPIAYLSSTMDFWSLHPANSRRSWDVAVSSTEFSSDLGFSSIDSVEIVSRYDSGSPSDIVITGISGGASATKHFTGRQIQSIFHLKSPHVNQIRGPFASGDPKVNRHGGANRYETAVAVSWANFDKGSGPEVVVVRGDLFPDALTAAPLATGIGGPVFLTNSTSLTDVLAAELDRLDPSKIYIVGGPAAVSDSVAGELAAYAPVVRLAGQNRYETAVEASKQVSPSGAGTVFIASGSDFPDAVSGSALAASRNSPLLLTRRNSLPDATRSELDRLNPNEIIVVGGSAVVSTSVIDQLKAYAPKVTVLAGSDRYGTSAEVARWGYPSGTERAFLATGTDFPDALAGSAIAGAVDGPILLVKQTTLPGSIEAEIQRLGVNEITLLGGPAAISYAVQDTVDDL
jgi:SpoIID/LytB domain protein